VSLALLVAAACLLASQVRSGALRLEEFTVYPEVFQARGALPEWLGSEDLQEFRDAAARIEPFSAFDDALPGRFEEAFSSIPWFRGVAEVRSVLPDQVELTLKIRKPIATVERSGWYHLVDRNATLLPGRFSRPPHGFRYPVPVIQGAGLSRPPRHSGETWDDRAVREGVAVALELYALYNSEIADRIRIERIDVRNVGGARDPRRSEIVLWTTGGVAIDWGRSLLYEGYGENPTQVKLDHLRRIDRERPGLQGLVSVGVLFDDPVWTPMAPETGSDVPAGAGPSGQ
jgi:hypothetical protein